MIDGVRFENLQTYCPHTKLSHTVNKYLFLQIQQWSDPSIKINDLIINDVLPIKLDSRSLDNKY